MGLFSKKKTTPVKEKEAAKISESKTIESKSLKSKVENNKPETTKADEKKKKVVASKPVIKKEKKEKGERLFVKEKHVLIQPLITEKVTDLAKNHQYVFSVDPDVNKIEIKNEIKKTYNVEPVKVNIITMSGKKVRYGRTYGKQKDWKKAIVILKKGDTIEVGKAK